MDSLRDLNISQISEVRGVGLWTAIEFDAEFASQVELVARQRGFLINTVKANAIRLAPPLIITKAELQTFIEALPSIVEEAVSSWQH